MADVPTITCKYTCHQCGIRQKNVEVRARKATESVVEWMFDIRLFISMDHRKTSPLCTSESMDLMIPIADQNKPLGTAVLH